MKAIYCTLVAALALLTAGCLATSSQAPSRGWTCFPTFGGCNEYGQGNYTANATVGLPFDWQLLAGCNTAQWNVNSVAIATGRLPPGLNLVGPPTRIAGVPTQAGSFSFTVSFSGISCPGSAYFPYGDRRDSYTIITTGN